MNGKIGGIKYNGKKIPVGSLQVRRNFGMIDHAIDNDVSYADIVSAELREVDREINRRYVRNLEIS